VSGLGVFHIITTQPSLAQDTLDGPTDPRQQRAQRAQTDDETKKGPTKNRPNAGPTDELEAAVKASRKPAVRASVFAKPKNPNRAGRAPFLFFGKVLRTFSEK